MCVLHNFNMLVQIAAVEVRCWKGGGEGAGCVCVWLGAVRLCVFSTSPTC